MARLARVVIPGLPHHITQRGNRRQQTFFNQGVWPWSSARAHLAGKDDQLVKVAPLLAIIGDWGAFLNSAMPEEELSDIRHHTRTGRPLGDETFLARLEGMVGRVLKPQKRGPKPKEKVN
jgi:putative transposase